MQRVLKPLFQVRVTRAATAVVLAHCLDLSLIKRLSIIGIDFVGSDPI